jgi:DNA polymerase
MTPKAPLARCDACPLRNRPVVHAESRDVASRVIVGEAPREQEVIEGRPFVGKSGRRLNKALAGAGLRRSDMYVTNAVLCRPVGRPPRLLQDAAEACHERLVLEVSRVGPRKVLAGAERGRVREEAAPPKPRVEDAVHDHAARPRPAS